MSRPIAAILLGAGIRDFVVTLIELSDLLQGSDAWLEQRRGIVTASVVGKLLTTTGRVASNDYSPGPHRAPGRRAHHRLDRPRLRVRRHAARPRGRAPGARPVLRALRPRHRVRVHGPRRGHTGSSATPRTAWSVTTG
jgi:hypothetical protein